MQIHRFSFSEKEKKIYSMSFGEKSVFWGVRIFYPTPELWRMPLAAWVLMIDDA
jgi:hypothetical protein